MPLYEFYCSECEKIDEAYWSRPASELECPDCGSPAHKILTASSSGLTVLGVSDSRPLKFGGEVFTSQSQLKAWERANPDSQMVMPGSKRSREIAEYNEARLDEMSKNLGYRDIYDYRARSRFREKGVCP